MQQYCECIYTKGMWYQNGPLCQNIHFLSSVCDVECVCLYRPKEMVMILAVGKMGHWANWTMHTAHCISAVYEAEGTALYLEDTDSCCLYIVHAYFPNHTMSHITRL